METGGEWFVGPKYLEISQEIWLLSTDFLKKTINDYVDGSDATEYVTEVIPKSDRLETFSKPLAHPSKKGIDNDSPPKCLRGIHQVPMCTRSCRESNRIPAPPFSGWDTHEQDETTQELTLNMLLIGERGRELSDDELADSDKPFDGLNYVQSDTENWRRLAV